MIENAIKELQNHVIELEDNQAIILEWMKLHMKVGHQ
jgi:hypothetical protein